MEISDVVCQSILNQIKKTSKSNDFFGGNFSSSSEADFRRTPGRFTLPLSTPVSRDAPGRSLRIKIPDVGLARRHLLWHLLFKGITVLEWFILSYLLELTLRGGLRGPCACFAGVLSLGSKTRKRLESWNSQLRPIHTILSSKIPHVKSADMEGIQSLLDLVIRELKIPQKALSKSELYTTTEIEIPKIRPKAERYIGVGYKDKGNLPSGNRLEPGPAEEDWIPTLNSRLEESLEVWKKLFD